MKMIPAMPGAYWRTWVAALLFFGAFYALLIPLALHLTDLRLADWQVGFILGAFGVASLVGRPLAGVCADRWGRQPLMLFGAAALAVGAAGVPLTRLPAALFGLRTIQAAGYVAFTTAATTRASDLAPPGRRGAALALFGVSVNLAMTVTPMLMDTWLEVLTTAGALWLSSGLAVAAGALCLHAGDGPTAGAQSPSWRAAFRVPGELRTPMAAAALFGIGFGAFLQFLPLLAQRRAIGSAGLGYAVYGAGIVLTRVVTARWQDRGDRGSLLGLAFLLLAAGLSLLALARGPGLLMSATGVIAVGSGVLHPGLIATHVEALPEEQRGRAIAGFYLAFDLGIGLGTWTLAPALESFGLVGLYFSAAALTALGMVVVRWLRSGPGSAPIAEPPPGIGTPPTITTDVRGLPLRPCEVEERRVSQETEASGCAL